MWMALMMLTGAASAQEVDTDAIRKAQAGWSARAPRIARRACRADRACRTEVVAAIRAAITDIDAFEAQELLVAHGGTSPEVQEVVDFLFTSELMEVLTQDQEACWAEEGTRLTEEAPVLARTLCRGSSHESCREWATQLVRDFVDEAPFNRDPYHNELDALESMDRSPDRIALIERLRTRLDGRCALPR